MRQKIVILGAGESGTGAAILASVQGHDVFLSDAGSIKDKYKKAFVEYNISFEEGSHDTDRIFGADLIIKSPGIPEKAPIVKDIRQKGIPVISEIEFGYRYTQAKIIAITGSNGKTTTTMLTYHILKNAGLNVGLAGNVGKSFAWQVATENFDYYVIELSSFQLDDIVEFRPYISMLLNITPDHLDRYEYKFENYIRSKFRIALNQKDNDVMIFGSDDKVIMEYLNELAPPCILVPFSHDQEQTIGGYINEKELTININNNSFIMNINELALQGRHNRYNSLAAGIAANVLDIRKDIIRESLMSFVSVEHRMEKVIKVHGIEFINDSKATNVNSTWYALESMSRPIIWIAGGVDKGNDYSELDALVKEKVKGMVFLGTDNSKLLSSFASFEKPKSEARSMKEAVKMAYKMAKPGDVILLSPACASFDLFENYEDRGIQFKKAIRDL
ncbi:MAG: UDP-N-acetylmuramoyl-L-alanine--D-glutamate ligase [Bacteroidetes bacterium HGW-Bacteroidetes-21]|jgi:UDP-N-acetylmuramoylalanine--D-glutamate ligase|nr:MAG: UDP-N-acetylmuramoyl-L-alanine--D-glutamate ligase [Bacteroidetes bacterium HGW-Bacteroidetes-21]